MSISIKKKITGLIGAVSVGLLLASQVFGAYSYSRDSGYYVVSPLNITFSADDFIADMCFDYPTATKWRVQIWENLDGGVDYVSPEYDLTTLSMDYNFVLPVNPYSLVILECYDTAWHESVLLEGEFNEQPTVFEVVDELPSAFSWIEVEENMPGNMLVLAGDLFTDFGSLIGMTIGVPMAFVVMKKIKGLF